MKVKIEFPFVKIFDDYHEIYYYRDLLNEIFVETIKSKEVYIRVGSGHYYGLFYINRLPPKQKIKEMLKKYR